MDIDTTIYNSVADSTRRYCTKALLNLKVNEKTGYPSLLSMLLLIALDAMPKNTEHKLTEAAEWIAYALGAAHFFYSTIRGKYGSSASAQLTKVQSCALLWHTDPDELSARIKQELNWAGKEGYLLSGSSSKMFRINSDSLLP